MDRGSHRPERPWWVRTTLFGASSRIAALFWFWIATGLATAVIAIGLELGTLLFGIGPLGLLFGLFVGVVLGGGGGFVIAALCYWCAIRWVDRHDGWSSASANSR